MFCSQCKTWVNDGQIYREDLSFSYSGTHCTYGRDGVHHEMGDLKSRCCDADLVDYNEDSEDR